MNEATQWIFDYYKYIFFRFSSCRSEKQHVKLPWDIEDAKKLGQVLDRYKDLYYFEVMFAVIVIYIL